MVLAEAVANAQTRLPRITVHGQVPMKPVPEVFKETVAVPSNSSPNQTKALQTVAGVHERAIGSDNQPSVVYLRGQDPIQNRIFLEGIPLTDAALGGSASDIIFPGMIKEIDVYPGATPVNLLDDGLGGALHYKLGELPGHDELTLQTGSFGHIVGSGVGRVGSRLSLGLAYQSAKDDFVYFDDNGTPNNPQDDFLGRRANNSVRRISIFPRATLIEGPTHRLSFFGLGTQLWREIPGPTFAPQNGNLQRGFALSGVSYKRADSAAHLYVRFDRQNLDHEIFGGVPAHSDSQDWAVGTKYQKIFSVSPALAVEAAVGPSYENYRVQISARPLDNSTKSKAMLPLSLSADLKFSQGRMGIAVLGQWAFYFRSGRGTFDGTALDAGENERSYLYVSPRISSEYKLTPQWQLRGLLGAFHRLPTLYELYGAPMGITPSPDLRPERAVKAELGTDYHFAFGGSWARQLALSYTYAIASASDLIWYTENSTQTRVASNIGNSLIQIHEFGVQVDAPLKWKTIFSVLDARNLSGISYQHGKKLPQRPAYWLRTMLQYQLNRFSVDYSFVWNGPAYWDLANLKELGPTTEHGLSFRLATKNIGLFSLELLNLTDTISGLSSFTGGGGTIVDNTTAFAGYPAAGRRFYLTWTVEL